MTLRVDDVVQPFQIEASALRGRYVRLGPVLDGILKRHEYPDRVAALLGEVTLLAALLGSALKYQGVFTLQTKGDGPVAMLVADMTSQGLIRGYASFDEDRLKSAGPGFRDLVGKGYLAFTVDQGQHTERYQGIVALEGETLTECVQHYFRQSEQLQAGVRIACGRVSGSWRAGGIMIQRLPEQGGAEPATFDEDDWRRAMILLGSAEARELIDPALEPRVLLYRLFNEDGIRAYEPGPLEFGCRCSREKVETVLRSLPREEVEGLKVGGRVEVACQFCNTMYLFEDAELSRIYEEAEASADSASGSSQA